MGFRSRSSLLTPLASRLDMHNPSSNHAVLIELSAFFFPMLRVKKANKVIERTPVS